jgi:hypothetical protein
MSKHMSLIQVLQQLNVPDALELMQPHWDESMNTLPTPYPRFLNAEVAVASASYCGLPATAAETLVDTCQQIQANKALLQLAWHCHQLLIEHMDYKQMKEWPDLTAALDENASVFYLLVALAIVPRIKELYGRKMGVPEDICRDSCRQIACFAGNYANMNNGALGITLKQLYWLRNYLAARLFRVGRFEYMIRPFFGGAQVYRSKKTNATIALAPDGTHYNADGYVADDWVAQIQQTDDMVIGYPISPYGMAIRKQVQLPLNEWECVLKKDDPILELHIPEGGSMHLDACLDSMHRGVAFFRQFFPNEPFQAIACLSWILNNQLQEIKLSSDNLARFQRELYLFPVKSNGKDGLWFIYLQDPIDLATVPRNTSLQRAVADFIQAGNTWRGGGMFFLTEDLDHLGEQHYRNNWPVKV